MYTYVHIYIHTSGKNFVFDPRRFEPLHDRCVTSRRTAKLPYNTCILFANEPWNLSQYVCIYTVPYVCICTWMCVCVCVCVCVYDIYI